MENNTYTYKLTHEEFQALEYIRGLGIMNDLPAIKALALANSSLESVELRQGPSVNLKAAGKPSKIAKEWHQLTKTLLKVDVDSVRQKYGLVNPYKTDPYSEEYYS